MVILIVGCSKGTNGADWLVRLMISGGEVVVDVKLSCS